MSLETIRKNNACISVIIAVYNDPEGLEITLRSLINQIYPKNQYEIIIVDNNSNDDTPIIIQKYVESYPDLIFGFTEKKIQSSYAARNKGIRESRGEILAFIDSDMWVKDDWLAKIFDIFKNNEKKYVGFNVKNVQLKKNIASLFDRLTGFPIKIYMQRSYFAGAGCIAVSREIFNNVGLFNSNLISGGDYEFGNRVHDQGYNLYYISKIEMYHPARDSIKSLILKWFRIGRGSPYLKKYQIKINKRSKKFQYNPLKLILPPNPLEIRELFIEEKNLSISMKIIVYLISWVKIIIIRIGYLYEKFGK